MLRLILIVTTAASVMLVIAAVFFCGEGRIGAIDREGMKHFRMGEYEQALGVWQPALEEFPDSWKLNYRVGTLLAVRKEFAAAEMHLRRALELCPTGREALEVRKELAICCLRQDKDDEAERELRRVIAEDGEFPEAHFYLGLLYERRGDPEQAMKEYVEEVNVNACCTFAWAKIFAAEKRGVTPVCDGGH
jgi:Tfp pilus assembly protein PilF